MHHFKITKDIEELKLDTIKENLFNYKYKTKLVKKLIQSGEPTTSDRYIAAYTSFKGEVFENIIYEHLVNYAKNEEQITKFVLKGPYQNQDKRNIKSGLMLDKGDQIVYKSAYKDISEFDALFFTKDSLYFVEISTSKKCDSLVKRLSKKYALLKVLFQNLNIRALIVLTQGASGVSKFPSYCTVWLTKDLEDDEVLHSLVFGQKRDTKLYMQDRKFVQTYKVFYEKFQYFQTLQSILNNSRDKSDNSINLNYFKTKEMKLNFDIFTKLYVGYIAESDFVKILPSYNLEAKESKVIVSIEKINTKLYDLVYYVKQKCGKLKRVHIYTNEVKIKDKELDGFTNTEVRFLYHILKPEHILDVEYLKNLKIDIN